MAAAAAAGAIAGSKPGNVPGKNPLFRLCLVTDRGMIKGRDYIEIIKQAIAGGVDCVQVREKTADTHTFLEVARAVQKLTKEAGIPLIINDRVDVALAIDADGVHVGQSDMPCAIVRKLVGPNKIVGVSASTLALAQEAEQAGADYVGTGAMVATQTKTEAVVCSFETLKQICHTVKIPVITIGGINSENTAPCVQAGAHGVAVVSFIMASKDPAHAAKSLRDKISGALAQAKS